MKIDYAMIATLTPRGLRDLAPLRAVVQMLERVLSSPLMARMLGVQTRRDLKLYQQQLADMETYNFCLRFKTWVKSDNAHIKWIRKVIGEAKIQRWERRFYAAYLARMMHGMADDVFKNSRQHDHANVCPVREFLRDPIYTCDMRDYERFMAGHHGYLGNVTKPSRKPIQWRPFGLMRLGLPKVATPINLAPRIADLPFGDKRKRGRFLRHSGNKRDFTPITFYPHELRLGSPREIVSPMKKYDGDGVSADYGLKPLPIVESINAIHETPLQARASP